jgi:hypothetical protein
VTVFSGQQFQRLFLLAQVDFAILGADFLNYFNLVVNHSAGQLLENTMLQSFLVVDMATCASSLEGCDLFAVVAATPPWFRGIFSLFQDAANQSGVISPAKHGVVHHIVMEGPLAMARFCLLKLAKVSAVKQGFTKLEKEGIICRFASS